MADDPGQKGQDKDPVAAIKGALNRAVKSLKRLMVEEDEEMREELDEVSSGGDREPPADKVKAKETITEDLTQEIAEIFSNMDDGKDEKMKKGDQ